MIAPALELKTIPDLLDTNSTHTRIVYAHLTAPHTCDYMGYVRTQCRARCEKQQKSLVIAWARICHVLTPQVEYLPTCLPDCHHLIHKTPSTAVEYTPGLDLRVSRAEYVIKFVHSFSYSFIHYSQNPYTLALSNSFFFYLLINSNFGRNSCFIFPISKFDIS